MLRELYVQNYALIKKLEINFHSGFSVITGETGAGKSILLGALSLALGQRADLSSLNNKDKKCIIEATFIIKNYRLQLFFKNQDIDHENTTIVRREISPNGKSRAFINDTPVNLNQLKELGEKLIDIHSQHQNLSINEQSFQFNLIDTYANNSELLKQYLTSYKNYINLSQQNEDLKTRNTTQKQQNDFITFQYKELETAQLKLNEQEELEQEQKLLSNSEEIAKNLNIAIENLNKEQFGVIEELYNTKNALSKIVEYFNNGENIIKRISSSLIDLQDLTQDLLNKSETIQYNPTHLDTINSRLDLIYSLQKKHNKQSIKELIELKEQYQKELEEFNSFDQLLIELENKASQAYKELNSSALSLHNERKKAALKIGSYISEQIKELGMPQGVFKIELTHNEKFNKYGNSQLTFKFTTDKNNQPQDITKIASGGELSRIMLLIKSLIASKKSLPTLIFDEIDTGISGEIANKMASIMKQMAKKMQIIAITHLPQIAAKGENHSIIYKTHGQEGASTHIKNLNSEERIHTIARMLSSAKPTPAALANAKELLNN